ncbi:hypothetical protein QE152_g38674 [Popillia japonica]|uniref:Double jelly roll-like domain-containing protein n=1 Tax=Popillia japonica TaxID=7064 RepID=A0AAW1HVS3_POPJA
MAKKYLTDKELVEELENISEEGGEDYSADSIIDRIYVAIDTSSDEELEQSEVSDYESDDIGDISNEDPDDNNEIPLAAVVNARSWQPVDGNRLTFNITPQNTVVHPNVAAAPAGKKPVDFFNHFIVLEPCANTEDYNKIIINASQELILVRSKSDDNSYKSELVQKRQRSKLKWEWGKWELYELPALRTTKDDIWSVRSTTNLEKPRYVIVAFQNKRKDNYKADCSVFDNSLIKNIKVYLNSENFPYNNMNLEISKDRYVMAYQMYAAFQQSYYNRTPQPLMDYAKFKNNALYVVDCSKQNDAVKTSTVDLKIEMETEDAFKTDTVAYCLILHDTIVEYTPLSGTVKKII